MDFRVVAGRAVDARGEQSNVTLRVGAGRISAVDSLLTVPAYGDIDARDATVLPGFIDIHVHGGAGRSVMEGTADAFSTVASHLARHGVTGFLATTITAPWDALERVVSLTADLLESGRNSGSGARLLGCHLEGPFINPEKKGAQPAQFIRRPDAAELKARLRDSLSAVKVMTLAPEMPGALELIRFLTEAGIIASIGHTNATYDEVSAAIDSGARHVTHCFNAMRPMGSREPGVVGAALCREELTPELIWDNIHVHPGSARALVAARGTDRVILVSDGIPGAGMPEGYRFSLGDLEIVCRDGAARLPDGTLAGSLLTLDTAFANACPYRADERSAMTSRNAAVSLGLGDRKGLLQPGYDADLVILGPDGSVKHTMVAGETVYRA